MKNRGNIRQLKNRARKPATVMVKVGPLDIKRGWRCSPGHCPVARAMKRALGSRHMHVATEYWDVDGAVFPNPREVTLFIKRFDRGQPVKPFTFRIRRPA